MLKNETEHRGEASFGLPAPVTDLLTLRRMVDELSELRARYLAKKTEASQLNEEAETLEGQIKQQMEAAGLERFDGTEASVHLREKTSVKVPATPEQKAAFFDYLRAQGVFDQLATVNSNTLNSWYRKEVEVLRSKGLPEEIPGIDGVSIYYDLSVRRK